jgi:hypothetical protein
MRRATGLTFENATRTCAVKEAGGVRTVELLAPKRYQLGVLCLGQQSGGVQCRIPTKP